MKTPPSHPILSSDETRSLEAKLFAGDEALEWSAMQRAGRAIAAAVLRDFQELGGFPAAGRILVLAGKGHNGGDALIAAQAILAQFPAARAEVIFAFGSRALRPLAARAWRDLVHAAGDRVASVREARGSYGLCLDGIFGFQFRPPADPRTAALIKAVNALPIRLRAAVDLPSADLFQADLTYATGCVKTSVLDSRPAGRVRYLDLGFFEVERADPNALSRVLLPSVLAPLAALRDPHADKRTFGHVFLVGGSRSYPGAILLSTLAALRSGAGLVTTCVPESLVPAFAARAPEAMWIGWPETPDGHLALEGEHLLRARLDRATALVIGPGLGREPETLALARSLVASSPVPLVIDADALQPDIVRAGDAARVLTPHAGEFARLGRGPWPNGTLVQKGPVTRIAHGATTYHSFFGGPVLARGGSGDLLAGLIGGLLAQTPAEPLLAAARGVVWHGLAADHLARAHGQAAVSVTQLLDFLSPALKESAHAP
ncbi:MAG: bifunctional ADP-dependent NAD(P)H-hydrate dehydratase/NAD(P)H-hydrate epimerase [Opitutaceae bacterium]|nr:bifunctional ADP-dependent NAD(P)H-hydrate dehydratase/NAD(P)H-hydrate epimerase [Opitutaceae bacterium]